MDVTILTGMAHELSNYQFHPTQTMKHLDTGETEVSFQCESIREVAYERVRERLKNLPLLA
jgi:hypothetical protein